MNTRKKIIQAIFNAIDELNNELDLQNQLKKDDETILLGKNSHLDSLGFVNSIVIIFYSNHSIKAREGFLDI